MAGGVDMDDSKRNHEDSKQPLENDLSEISPKEGTLGVAVLYLPTCISANLLLSQLKIGIQLNVIKKVTGTGNFLVF